MRLLALAATAVLALTAPAAISAQVTPSTLAGVATICPKYATAFNITGQQLITAIVARAVLGTTLFNADTSAIGGDQAAPLNFTGAGVNLNTVDGIVFRPLLANYFNGQALYDLNNPAKGATGTPRNFVASYQGDKQIFSTLATKLVLFFGGALGCGTPAFSGLTMKAAHAGMNITKAIMDDFNGQVLQSFTSFGGDATADGPAATYLLHRFNRNAGDAEICTDATCDISTAAVSGGSSSSSSSTGSSGGGGGTGSSTGTSAAAFVAPSVAVAFVALIATMML